MQNETETTLATIGQIVGRFAPKSLAKLPITRETRLVEDLGIDSPRMIDIVLEVEDRFDVCLEDADVQETGTVGSLLDLVERQRSNKVQ
jgi:acyl carrier protein